MSLQRIGEYGIIKAMNGRSVSFAAALLAAFAVAAVPLLSANGGEEYPELPRRIAGETDEAME